MLFSFAPCAIRKLWSSWCVSLLKKEAFVCLLIMSWVYLLSFCGEKHLGTMEMGGRLMSYSLGTLSAIPKIMMKTLKVG